MIHVYPVNDEKEHDTSGYYCDCDPELEFVPDAVDTDSLYIVKHKSYDGREFAELADDVVTKKVPSLPSLEDLYFKPRSIEEMLAIRKYNFFRIADLRYLDRLFYRDEISYSKIVEIINQMAFDFYRDKIK